MSERDKRDKRDKRDRRGGRNGADEEFEQHLTAVLPSARRFAARLSAGRFDPDDIVQEASLKAFQAFDRFEPGSSFHAWFFTIVRNGAFQRHRYWGRRGHQVELDPERTLGSHGGVPADLRPEFDITPLDSLVTRRMVGQVDSAIAALPPAFSQACRLRFLREYTYEEISQELECPVGTVRSRIHRGTKMLQDRLLDVWEEYKIAV